MFILVQIEKCLKYLFAVLADQTVCIMILEIYLQSRSLF